MWVDRDTLEETFLERTRFQRETGTPIWVGEFGPVYTGDPERDEQRYQVLCDQLDIYDRHGAGWSIWTYKDVGLHGLVELAPESPYMERFGDLIAKKRRLGVDAWGSTHAELPEVIEPLHELIAREFPSWAPYPWGVREATDLLVRHILLAQAMLPEYAERFRGLGDDELDELADSFALERCRRRDRLSRRDASRARATVVAARRVAGLPSTPGRLPAYRAAWRLLPHRTARLPRRLGHRGSRRSAATPADAAEGCRDSIGTGRGSWAVRVARAPRSAVAVAGGACRSALDSSRACGARGPSVSRTCSCSTSATAATTPSTTTSTIDYDPIAHSMVSSTDITARATQGLSEFSLDFVSYYTVSSVKVNGVDATWTRDDDLPNYKMKLVVTPAAGIPNGSTFHVVVAYSGTPQNFVDSDGSLEGFMRTTPSIARRVPGLLQR